MGRWEVLKAVTSLIDNAGIPVEPPNRLGLLYHIGRGSLSVLFRRPTVAILLNKLHIGAGEILLTESPALKDVLFASIRQRRPAFVLRGSLAPVCRYFGVDEDHALTLRCSSSGLAVCFGHLQGREVVVHASINGNGGWVKRQFEGAKLGREAMPGLGPEILDVREGRLTTAKLPGHASPPWQLTEKELQAAIIAGLEPLKEVFDCGRWARRPDDELLQALESFVARSSHRSELQPALDLLQEWDRAQVKTVMVHGDYWLNNILFSQGQVTGVVDWDRTRAEGCAGIDALHLAFMSYAAWSDVEVSELLADVCTEQWHFPWLSSYCALIRDAFSLRADDLKHLAILLWLSYFPHYDEVHGMVPSNNASRNADWYAQMSSPMRHAIAGIRRQQHTP